MATDAAVENNAAITVEQIKVRFMTVLLNGWIELNHPDKARMWCLRPIFSLR
jgi:hypothetical protein